MDLPTNRPTHPLVENYFYATRKQPFVLSPQAASHPLAISQYIYRQIRNATHEKRQDLRSIKSGCMIIVAMTMMMMTMMLAMIMTMMIAMTMMILIIILIYICDNRESNGAKDARATESNRKPVSFNDSSSERGKKITDWAKDLWQNGNFDSRLAEVGSRGAVW